MSKIARRITGFDNKKFFEYETPSTSSANDFYFPENILPRDIRMFMKTIIGPEDLNSEREKLKNNIPECLRAR